MLTLLAGLATASAGNDTNKVQTAKPARPKAEKAVKQTAKDEYLTGSRIKQNIRRNGLITDGGNNVIVLDRSTIDHSGGATVIQVLGLQNIR